MYINKLKIYTQNLQEQIRFYSLVLGLEIIQNNVNTASFRMGDSILVLQKSAKSNPYHFAVNIPCNRIQQALIWLKDRVEILTGAENEIHEFHDWHAQALYFYDSDKNIVELIARQNLHNASDDIFSEHSFLEISEIGLPVDEIAPIYKQIHEATGMNIYSGDKDRFCAIGDEHGLFICINKYKKDWFPTMEKAYSSAFELQFFHNNKEWLMEFSRKKPYILTLK
ncbi:VOC family protein [Saccharicrinis sp. FJH54]|uniref:VOC family protein n=1 Tax=Saccharicrinis sp. FJH54 TaxID=3344665 RepID=UPI0035D4302A